MMSAMTDKLQEEKEWGIKFQTVFDIEKSNSKNEVIKTYSRKNLNELLKSCLGKISTFMNDMQKYDQ
jgi:hypothetical protein